MEMYHLCGDQIERNKWKGIFNSFSLYIYTYIWYEKLPNALSRIILTWNLIDFLVIIDEHSFM